MNFKKVDEEYLDKLLKELNESDQLSANEFEKLIRKSQAILSVTKQKLNYVDIQLQNEKLKVQYKKSGTKVDELLG
jgi:hypothetical protein